MKQKGVSALIIIIVLAILGVIGYLGYKFYNQTVLTPKPVACTLEARLCPDGSAVGRSGPNCEFAPCPSPTTSGNPSISTPSANSTIKSPLTVKGTVPTGWMFEGVFPIKLVDENQKIIVQGQATEVTPGSWQSGNPVLFTAKLTFTTKAKTGFLVLENDNPSGDPTKAQIFELPVAF